MILHNKTAVIIDHSAYMRSLIKIALQKQHYQIIGEASSGSQGLELIEELSPDIATLDTFLPDMLGIDILETIRNKGNDIKVIIIASVTHQILIDRARLLGIEGYIAKPFEDHDFDYTLNKMANV